MEAIFPSETSADSQQTTQRHIAEDGFFLNGRRLGRYTTFGFGYNEGIIKVQKQIIVQNMKLKFSLKKLHGLSPRANYTDRATAACRRSDFQLLRIEGATWSA
jgi:hypothetical protein